MRENDAWFGHRIPHFFKSSGPCAQKLEFSRRQLITLSHYHYNRKSRQRIGATKDDSFGSNPEKLDATNVFRCSPNNGHRQDTSACPFRAQADIARLTQSPRQRAAASKSAQQDQAPRPSWCLQPSRISPALERAGQPAWRRAVLDRHRQHRDELCL